VCFSAFW